MDLVLIRGEVRSSSEPARELALYRAPDGTVTLDVRLEGETLWLTQKQMAELFETERSVITKHLNNIFASGELDRESNVQKMHIAGADRPATFHALHAATGVLRDHLVQGCTINRNRLHSLHPWSDARAALDRRHYSHAVRLTETIIDYKII